MTEPNKSVSKFTNLEPNMAAALAYVVTPFTGVFFLVVEKEDKNVKFHAMQSIMFGVAAYVAWAIANALVIVVIGRLLVPLVSVTSFALYLYLMWKAYNGEHFELPVIGRLAREQISKS